MKIVAMVRNLVLLAQKTDILTIKDEELGVQMAMSVSFVRECY